MLAIINFVANHGLLILGLFTLLMGAIAFKAVHDFGQDRDGGAHTSVEEAGQYDYE